MTDQSNSAGSRADAVIRVLLADDEEMIRHSVRVILKHADDIEVVGEAANGAEVVRLAAEHGPDVVLLDVCMPVLDGLAAVEPLVALDPAPQVVMLTTFDDEENVLWALRAGATGFLLKDEGPQELIRAVRAAVAGDAVLSPGVTGSVIRRMLGGGSAGVGAAAPGSRVAGLTDRERDVLVMLGAGLSNLEIGTRLGIGVGTVKTHVGSILGKTGCESRVQAALVAYQAGLMS
ncbi:response regulator transcription factor [Streptomyces sp. NEAU-S7GS2]|uniref:response regulator n=1 Tax=Streptomyces sp. NEAU-S7GS2 TaxID=2202000 RepID=UPI000D6ED039|nr:response regulator transcription factor [Streptomyces sp. NEAU-S7GS2]AWN30690.1 DNA-binding response regulator [Streptomyces sp. NEAU-S7GS2]